jgi:valyl-tRNA synthetase
MKLAKTYDPQAYEPRIYQLWEESKAFRPTGDPKKGYFSIALPPPNANGDLHLGHALTIAVEDLMVRYRRLKGESTVFIPGADHAGFETWVMFEKELEKQGKSRFDFSRDQLYSMIWDFVEQQRGNMEIQLRELGASVDWDSFVFTLDKKVIDRTYKTFQQLWDEGLIYRGERIVNYCTKHQTSFADLEVDHRIEKSKLWSIAYSLADADGEIVVATTRPETLLGDTAIAVNPKDPRYKKLVGKHAVVPLTGREIPIVADDAIEASFGTGAVKVTPAHDPVDFEIGERHKLPIIQVIGFDGAMTEECPPQFAGLPADEARKAVLKALEAEQRVREVQDYSHSVGHCYKCKTVIQPLVKDQWFLKMRPLAEKAIKAIKNGEITFTPKSKANVLISYLENLKDWNLSRQIAWGIPIPAFQSSEDPSKWVFDSRVDRQAIEVDGVVYNREEDTFDTWFSSGQWPFITTDYTEKGALNPYYPLSVMETAADILFFWVARMIMLGLYVTDKVPFKHVYLHGLVLDEHGVKMSKSKGNGINPQDIVKQYGSDATRMGLLAGRGPGVGQAFTTGSIVAGRNFANKLWNIARYVEDKLGSDVGSRTPKPETLADHWMLERLNKAGETVGKLIESYRFAEAYDVVYHTVWNDLADWYIECSKVNNNPSVLAYSLETCLKLAHPFAPFVTETIWQTLGWEKGMLVTSTWPTPVTANATAAKKFTAIQALVSETRLASASLGQGKQELVFTDEPLIESDQELIAKLAGLKSINKVEKGRGMRLAAAGVEAWLDISDETLRSYKDKLHAQLTEADAQVSRLEARLANKGYVANAPESIVQETRNQLLDQKQLKERLGAELSRL